MKKIYQKPVINTVRINTELPMATSGFSMNINNEPVSGSEALGNMEGGFDIWGNENGSW